MFWREFFTNKKINMHVSGGCANVLLHSLYLSTVRCILPPPPLSPPSFINAVTFHSQKKKVSNLHLAQSRQ